MSRQSRDKEKRKLKLAATDAPIRTAAWLWSLLLIAATVTAYRPALPGTFIWDDDSWTTVMVALLRDATGLRTIWFNPAALQQYYPLAGTTFWLDYHFWGFTTLPYHVENVLLHACAALLFWKLLARLQVPGAWLAAGIFALHPVMVESAGWITERKNVLSLVLFLGALLAYGRFTGFWRDDELPSATTGNSPPRRWGAWALAFFLLLGALFSKTTAFSFPAVVLLLCWWERGRIRWRADVLPVLPFFALAIGLSLITSSMEKYHVGAQGRAWAIPFAQRCLIAGRAFWFYLGKLSWPTSLCFIYPRWKLDTASFAQWVYPITAAGVVISLWLARKRIGRGPVTAVFFFVGTLFPVLGFMNAFFMRYSFVCDHWTYLSSLGPIALAAALIARAAVRFRTPALPYIFAVIVLPVLGLLTWHQCGMYTDMETLWRTTLARNPNCPMAENNLGVLLADQGKLTEAIQHYNQAIQLEPDDSEAYNNLGIALAKQGKSTEALQDYERAVQLDPGYAEAHCNLGYALARQGKVPEAIQQYERALELDSNLAEAHYDLANALAKQGRLPEAVQHYERAVQVKPDYVEAHINYGITLAAQGKLDEAIQQYKQALRLKADIAETQGNLGNALAAQGKFDEARSHFEQALKLATAQNNPALAEAIRKQLESLQPAAPTPTGGK